MNYCHKKGLIHRDLKLANILLSQPNSLKRLKIIDFGIAGIIVNGQGEKNGACTLAYSPPEHISGKDTESRPSLDIWSLGIIMYCILTLKMPFRGKNGDEISLYESIQKDRVKFPKGALAKEAKDLIKRMLDKDAKTRITMDQIFKHPWIKHNLDEKRDQSEIDKYADESVR